GRHHDIAVTVRASEVRVEVQRVAVLERRGPPLEFLPYDPALGASDLAANLGSALLGYERPVLRHANAPPLLVEPRHPQLVRSSSRCSQPAATSAVPPWISVALALSDHRCRSVSVT